MLLVSPASALRRHNHWGRADECSPGRRTLFSAPASPVSRSSWSQLCSAGHELRKLGAPHAKPTNQPGPSRAPRSPPPSRSTPDANGEDGLHVVGGGVGTLLYRERRGRRIETRPQPSRGDRRRMSDEEPRARGGDHAGPQRVVVSRWSPSSESTKGRKMRGARPVPEWEMMVARIAMHL